MKFLVLFDGVAIGEVDAPRTYSTMGMTGGEFSPFESYVTIRSHMQRANSTDEWLTLVQGLVVATRNGYVVPTNFVGLDEMKDEGTTIYHIEFNVDYIVFEDDQFWKDPVN